MFPRPDSPRDLLVPSLVRTLYWTWAVGVVAIVVVSLLPDFGPPSEYGTDRILHCIAYAGAGGVPFAVFANRRAAIRTAFAMIALGVALEIAQHWIPGRTSDPWDATADTLGVVIGAVLGPYGPGWIVALFPAFARAGEPSDL